MKRYENNTVVINQLKKSNSAESIKPLTQKNKELKKITDEIVVYTEEGHLESIDEAIVELYEKYKNAILNLVDGIEIKPQKYYIAFKKNTNVVDIAIYKKALKVWINAKYGQLDDSKKLARDVRKIGHRGNGDYELNIKNDKDLEYVMSLIKQLL